MSYCGRKAFLSLFDSILVIFTVYLTYFVIYGAEILGNPLGFFQQQELVLIAVILTIVYHVIAVIIKLDSMGPVLFKKKAFSFHKIANM